MGIDIADASAHQLMTFDEEKHFVVSGNWRDRQFHKLGESIFPVRKIAASQLANYHRVHQHLVVSQ